jgi:Holliday junction resolvase RusA-like endonuclease
MKAKSYDSWRLEVPWLPVSLNVYMRQHFRVRDEQMQSAVVMLKPYLRVVLDDLGIDGPLPWKAEMTFEVYARKQRDDDNCVVARKVLLDAMRKLNFLRNDDPRCVRSIDLPCAVDRDRPRTVITIKKMEANI